MATSASIDSIDPTLRRVTLSARPPRVATVIPPVKGWLHIALRMIENYSVIWGGAGNVLVPLTDAGDIEPLFERVIQVFDPDFLGTWSQTRLHCKLANPKAFDEKLMIGAE